MSEEPNLWAKIKDKDYCDPKKRMDFILIFDVKDGNPNGDPDAGNLPRIDPATGHGIVTDVCTKRKVRDYLATVLGRSIYIQSQSALNSLYFEAAREIVEYDSDKDVGADSKDKKRRREDKEAVEALLVELAEKEPRENGEELTEFGKLIAVPEAGQTPGVPSGTGDTDGPKSFREWLSSVSDAVDGLEFSPDEGRLSYLGEAKSKADFKNLLSDEDLEPAPFKAKIDCVADLLATAKRQIKGGAQERQARDAVKRKMCDLYDDIRLFGAVLTAGTNAGQIRGPMQLTFGRSIERIFQQDAAITRCAITKATDWAKKQTEFGRKPWLSWAIYRQHGFFNPLLGDQTGLSKDDLARFWEALASMFSQAASASKGEMAVQDLIVFVHNNKRGNAPSHKLFNRVKVERNGQKETEREFSDCYKVTVNDADLAQNGVAVHRPLKDLWAL